ncbi:hypothetical protein [Xanthomonas euvesicatoria]|uniref:antitoxin VbhA family protein n=1 Tax=Xanthomonas euvesicatoria TaxID=456327 RepID=UPI003B680CE2
MEREQQEQEQEQRKLWEEAMREAAASLRIEGLGFSEENADLRKAWVEGTMTGDQVREAMMARAIARAKAAD